MVKSWTTQYCSFFSRGHLGQFKGYLVKCPNFFWKLVKCTNLKKLKFLVICTNLFSKMSKLFTIFFSKMSKLRTETFRRNSNQEAYFSIRMPRKELIWAILLFFHCQVLMPKWLCYDMSQCSCQSAHV